MPDVIRSGHAAMYDEVPHYDYGSCQVQTAAAQQGRRGAAGGERGLGSRRDTKRTNSPVPQKMTGWGRCADYKPIRVIGWEDKRRV